MELTAISSSRSSPAAEQAVNALQADGASRHLISGQVPPSRRARAERVLKGHAGLSGSTGRSFRSDPNVSNLVKVTIFIADCEYVRRSQSRGCVGRVVGDHWPSALTVVVDGLALLYRTIANCPAAVGAGLGSRGTGVQWIVDSRRALALASLL